MVIKDPDMSVDVVMKALVEKGIVTRHFFYPMYRQPALVKEGCCSKEVLEDSQYCNSNYISEHGFYIPNGLGLTYEEQKYLIDTIRILYK